MSDLAAPLEPFLLLAKSAKGAAAAKVVDNATSAPGVYVFSELLDQPNIQELQSDSTLVKHHTLLKLFAYGTLHDYKSNVDSIPSLSPAKIIKLKHLTLVSIALKNRSIPYDQLLDSLEISSIRDLEDLIIDVIYAGLLGGKLHHQEKVLHVDWVAGRDVAPEDLQKLVSGLSNWCRTSQTLLTALEEEIQMVQEQTRRENESDWKYRKYRDEQWEAASKESKNGNKYPSRSNTQILSGANSFEAGYQQAINQHLGMANLPSKPGGDNGGKRGGKNDNFDNHQSRRPRGKRTRDQVDRESLGKH